MPKPRKKKKMHMQWSCFFEIFTPIPLQPVRPFGELAPEDQKLRSQLEEREHTGSECEQNLTKRMLAL